MGALLRRRRRGGLLSPAGALLSAVSNGFALSFETESPSARIKWAASPASEFDGDPNGKLLYPSPPTKWIVNKDGILSSGTTLRTAFDAAGAALGLLVEPTSRVNLAYASDMSTGFVTSNLQNSGASVALPTGANGGRALTSTEVNTSHFSYPGALAGGLTANTDYAITAVVKAAARKLILNLQGSANNWASAVFDVDNLSATSASQTGVGSASGTIVSTSQYHLCNGWVVCVLVARCATSSTPCLGLVPAATGNTFSATTGLVSYLGTLVTGLHAFHFQVEAASSASSRIVTTTGSATRAADDIKIAKSAIPWNGGVGTLTVDGIVTTPTTDATYLKIVPRSGQNYVKTFMWVPSA